MTTIIVVVVGIGVVFIASSLDCTPIRDTFTAIVTNQPVDWSGTKNCTATIPRTPTQGAPATIGAGTQGRLINPNPDGTCPSGYTSVIVSNGKRMCERNT